MIDLIILGSIPKVELGLLVVEGYKLGVIQIISADASIASFSHIIEKLSHKKIEKLSSQKKKKYMCNHKSFVYK